jgi:hypothetical protein
LKIEKISWDQETVDHISNHLVSPEEVEEVLFNDVDPPLMMRGKELNILLMENSWRAAIVDRMASKYKRQKSLRQRHDRKGEVIYRRRKE